MQADTIKIAWAAGIIDGEGCISLAKLKQHKYPGRAVHSLRVTVGNTDHRMLDELQRIFGGKIYPELKGGATKVGRRKPMWQWLVMANTAVACIQAVRPYLVCKGDQADVALRYVPGRRGRRVTGAEMATRDAISAELTVLKRSVA